MVLKGYALSVIGSREKNQDAFLINDERGLYAVADGVGGGLQGEVASRMAVDGLLQHATPTANFKAVVELLQAQILRESMETLGDALMGTTLTAIRIVPGNVQVAHVGDSRLYHFSDGLLKLKTEDHESYDETLNGPVLSSYLGIPSDFHPLVIQEEQFSIRAGEKLLLCSDGLYRQMSDVRMTSLVRQHCDTPEELLKVLANEATRSEYSDNVTVVWVEIT